MFFTDAVVAIAMTLLVLPLTDIVPDLVAHHEPASAAITENGTKLLSFLLSFWVIGRLWYVHHQTFTHIRSLSAPVVLLNFVWLLAIAVMPFPTELVGAYPPERFTSVFYIGTMLVANVTQAILLNIARTDDTVRGDAEPVTEERVLNSLLNGAVFVLAIIVALFDPNIAFYVLILMAFPAHVAKRIARTA